MADPLQEIDGELAAIDAMLASATPRKRGGGMFGGPGVDAERVSELESEVRGLRRERDELASALQDARDKLGAAWERARDFEAENVRLSDTVARLTRTTREPR